jgi:putative DNA primase/helicase
MDDEVIGNTNLELALSLGFSAAVVGMLSTIKDVDTLIMHICGKSTRGKTTAAQLAVSPFGRPSKTLKGLIKSWNATGNAVVSYLRNNHGVPIVLDEASMSNLKDFTTLIYTFAENREKDRMTKDGGLREQGDWSTTIISTAEHSIFQKTNANEGLRVRVFEFANTTWTTSGKNADELKRRLLEHYGYAGIAFVQYLQSLGVEEVERRCNQWKVTCEETLSHSDFITRVSEKFGLILATAEMVNESLNLGLDLESMIERLYEVEQEISVERNQSDKAYQFMLEQVIQNYECFLSNDRLFKGNQCWGVIKYETEQIEVSIFKNQFNRLMKEANVSDPKVVLEEWREEKRLKTEPNKFSNRRKVGTKEFRTQMGIPEPTGSKEQSIVYVMLFDKNHGAIRRSQNSPA